MQLTVGGERGGAAVRDWVDGRRRKRWGFWVRRCGRGWGVGGGAQGNWERGGETTSRIMPAANPAIPPTIVRTAERRPAQPVVPLRHYRV